MAHTMPPTAHPHEGAPEPTPEERAFLDALTGPAPDQAPTPLIEAGMLEPTEADMADAARQLAPYLEHGWDAMADRYAVERIGLYLRAFARDLAAGWPDLAAEDIREARAMVRAAGEAAAR